MIGSALAWVAGPGWEPFFSRFDEFPYRDAEEFRMRYMTQAMRGLVGA